MPAPLTEFRCLEMMPVRWSDEAGNPHCECAVLHEIGSGCGLFQTDQPAAPGTAVRIQLPQQEISGVVESCEPDESGYILGVSIDSPQEWLEGRYRPSVLIPLTGNDLDLPMAS